MNTSEEIKRLADLRLEGAEILFLFGYTKE
jgi:hypothetical protein